jgi:hypothetical protein
MYKLLKDMNLISADNGSEKPLTLHEEKTKLYQV